MLDDPLESFRPQQHTKDELEPWVRGLIREEMAKFIEGLLRAMDEDAEDAEDNKELTNELNPNQ